MTSSFSLRLCVSGLILFHRKRHESRLNTIHENPQISPMTQIFLCASASLR